MSDTTTPVDKTCQSVDWFTPPRILDPVRRFFTLRPGSGVIDVDPCTAPSNPVGATDFYTAKSNGLTRLWYGNVFVNPPYGRAMKSWCKKIADEARWFHTRSSIVALLPGQRFETSYWQEHILDPAILTAIVFVRKRLHFVDESGARLTGSDGKTKSGNPYGSMLYIYDRHPMAWGHVCMAFGHLGYCLRVDDVCRAQVGRA